MSRTTHKKHSVTSQKNWFLGNKDGRTLNIGYIGGRVNVNCHGKESEVIWPTEGNITFCIKIQFVPYREHGVRCRKSRP